MSAAVVTRVRVTAFPSDGGPPARGGVELRYELSDPWAVWLRPGGVVWVFARDLLADGLAARAGDGDVTVAPLPGGQVAIELADVARGGPSRARLLAEAGEVSRFLARTFRRVPRGEEDQWVDFDQLTARLLAGGGIGTDGIGTDRTLGREFPRDGGERT